MTDDRETERDADHMLDPDIGIYCVVEDAWLIQEDVVRHGGCCPWCETEIGAEVTLDG